MIRAETVTPPSALSVLIGGIATMRKRPRGVPVLPAVRIARTPVTVDRGEVAAYEAVCGFDGSAGVPPTFPHILAFPLHMALMMRRDFPYPLAGLVHVANRIRQHARIGVGDALAIEAWFGGLVAHPRGQAFRIDAAARRGDAIVWESASTYLYRSRRPAAGPAIDPPIDPPAAGETLWRGGVPRSVGKRYARVSGDRNPIHVSALGARAFGFPRPIAHGMWSLARSLAVLLPATPVEAATIDVSFRAPVLLGAEVLLRADDGAFALTNVAGERIHLTGRIA